MTTAATTLAEPGVRHADDHDVGDAGSAQRLLDVGDQDGGPAGEHHLGTPSGDGEHPPSRLPRSPTVAKPSASTVKGPSPPS